MVGGGDGEMTKCGREQWFRVVVGLELLGNRIKNIVHAGSYGVNCLHCRVIMRVYENGRYIIIEAAARAGGWLL